MSEIKKNDAVLSEEDLRVLDDELATAPDYTHKFFEPFEWQGKSFTTLEFNFAKLRGSDALAIYRELQMRGIMVVTARTSPDFQIRLASRACGLGTDAFEAMSFRDFEAILSKARNFIPAAALL